MLQTLRKSGFLLHSVKAITQATNIETMQIARKLRVSDRRFFATENRGQMLHHPPEAKEHIPESIRKGIVSTLGDDDAKEGQKDAQKSNSLTAFVYNEESLDILGFDEEVNMIAERFFENNVALSRHYIRHNTNPTLLNMRACAYVEMSNDNINQARAIIKELIKANPNNKNLIADLMLIERCGGNHREYLRLKRIVGRIGNRKEALDKVKDRKEEDPSDVSIHSIFDPKSTRLGSEAAKLYVDKEEATLGDRENPPVFWDDLEYTDKREERAARRETFSRAIQMAPMKIDLILKWAEAEANDGCIHDALYILNNGIRYIDGPGKATLLLEAGKYFFILNDIKHCSDYITQALKDPAGKVEAASLIVELNELTKSVDTGVKLYQYIADQNPTNTQIWSNYLDYLKQHNRMELYESVAQEAYKRNGTNRLIAKHFISSLLYSRDYKQAFDAINVEITKKPNSILTYEYLLAVCEGHPDPRVLNYIYHEGIKHITTNSFLYTQYAEFLEEMRNYEGAKNLYLEAYSITPNDDLGRAAVRMMIELRDYEKADLLLDELIKEYSNEVVYSDGKLYRVDNKDDENREEEDDEDEVENGATPDDAEYYKTAEFMTARLIADKAMLATRQLHHEHASYLMKVALELDPTDPYIRLLAIEEVYQPSGAWRDIIESLRLIPIIDPNREFMEEARSIRQSLLETIMDSEATNQQIYDIYHIRDDSHPEVYRQKDHYGFIPEDDYWGRDRFTHSTYNDGLYIAKYGRHDDMDYDHDKELELFDKDFNKKRIEEMGVAEFYKKMPANLAMQYCNMNWYDIPLMKEWMETVPEEKRSESIDWTGVYVDENDDLSVPKEDVFKENGEFKVSLEELEALRKEMSMRYECVPEELRQSSADLSEIKSLTQAIRDVRKSNPAFFETEFHKKDDESYFPEEDDEFAAVHMFAESLKKFTPSYEKDVPEARGEAGDPTDKNSLAQYIQKGIYKVDNRYYQEGDMFDENEGNKRE